VPAWVAVYQARSGAHVACNRAAGNSLAHACNWGGKMTRRLPPAFATISKALAMLGEFLCHPLHQFGVDAHLLLRLLHAGQCLHHYLEFLLRSGTMEAIDLAFAPCHVEGSTMKKKCIVAIAVAIGVTPLCPGVATIIWQAIPPLWNQWPLQPALNPRNCLFSPSPLPLPPPLCNHRIPLARQQLPAGCWLLLQRYPCLSLPLLTSSCRGTQKVSFSHTAAAIDCYYHYPPPHLPRLPPSTITLFPPLPPPPCCCPLLLHHDCGNNHGAALGAATAAATASSSFVVIFIASNSPSTMEGEEEKKKEEKEDKKEEKGHPPPAFRSNLSQVPPPFSGKRRQDGGGGGWQDDCQLFGDN
jgi:hypothetical protein